MRNDPRRITLMGLFEHPPAYTCHTADLWRAASVPSAPPHQPCRRRDMKPTAATPGLGCAVWVGTQDAILFFSTRFDGLTHAQPFPFFVPAAIVPEEIKGVFCKNQPGGHLFNKRFRGRLIAATFAAYPAGVPHEPLAHTHPVMRCQPPPIEWESRTK